MIRHFNDPEYISIFEDKAQFADKFRQFFQRDWISTKDLTFNRFEEFLRHCNKLFIYKPNFNAQGRGIKVYSIEENWHEL